MRSHRILLMAAVVAGCASASAALAAGPYTPQLRYTASDQRLARSIVLEKADLPDLGGTWKGGFVKPVVTGDSCLRARQSDLVLTGAAETEFEDEHALVNSNVWVLKTPRMVRLDASRQPSFAVEARCAREVFAGDASVKVRSVSKLSFPAYGVGTDATRVTYDLTTSGDTTRLIDDTVTVFLGRVEISLWVVTTAASRAAADSIERSLMKLLVLRATPVKLLGYTHQFDMDSLVAGAPFTLTGFRVRPNRIGDYDNTGSVWTATTPDAMQCSASIGTVRLPSAGSCRWNIPADANGKTLDIVVNATYRGAKAAFRLDLPIGIGA